MAHLHFNIHLSFIKDLIDFNLTQLNFGTEDGSKLGRRRDMSNSIYRKLSKTTPWRKDQKTFLYHGTKIIYGHF